VRVFLEVVRPLASPPDAPPVPEGVELVGWSDAVDEAARLAHAEAFAEHWGTEPRTAEEWRQWYTGHRGFRPDLSRVAVREGSDEVVGFVLAAAYPADWEHDVREAWIHSLGTRDAWRGRGVGRALLLESIRAMAAADDRFDRAILGVDSRNEGALALYTSVGFEPFRAATSLGRAP
jgi:ribosomal protein S18 acetylase RimI-like enzyme